MRYVLSVCVILAALTQLADADEHPMRTWTSSKGSSLEARYLRRSGAFVVLGKKTGGRTMIHLTSLSKEDRQYVADLQAAAKKALTDKRASLRSPRTSRGSRRKDQQPDYLSEIEWNVLVETSLARTDPPAFAKHLKAYRAAHVGDGVFATERGKMRTKEGGCGHRKNIFIGAYKVAGIAIGPHKAFGNMCVIDFAGGFSD
jgi:hypothetical protein